ncbi:MAG: lyase family protein, partial [archaeon]
KDGKKIEERTMRYLDLKPTRNVTQVISRDAHAEVLVALSFLMTLLGKIAKEFRILSQTEIGEVSPPFAEDKQIGSSTMPQKINPWEWESIRGLKNYVKSKVAVAFDNQVLWSERDMSHSAPERMIFPEALMITYVSLETMIRLTNGLIVREGMMKKNLNLTRGRIMAEAVAMHLIAKGMTKSDAYNAVKKCALESQKKDIDFADALKGKGLPLNNQEIEFIVNNPQNYIGDSVEFIEEKISKYVEFLYERTKKYN